MNIFLSALLKPGNHIPWVKAANKLFVILLASFWLNGCAGRIETHGHVLTKEDLQQVYVGMDQEQVRLSLGTPNTTSSIGNKTFYYISTKKRTVSLFKPQAVDRQIVAIYFNAANQVQRIANYGLKDGKVFDFHNGVTPSHGGDTSLIKQLLGNLGGRARL